MVQAASAKRVTLGLNLDAAPDDPRVIATPTAMCGYRVNLEAVAAVDADVARWLEQAYKRAG